MTKIFKNSRQLPNNPIKQNNCHIDRAEESIKNEYSCKFGKVNTNVQLIKSIRVIISVINLLTPR